MNPGEYNWHVTFEKLTIKREREEPIRYYVQWKEKWVKIEEQTSSYGTLAGAPTASGTVRITLHRDLEFADTSIKNYEAFRFRHHKDVPVYMTDFEGQILYDEDGFPMIQENQNSVQYYYLTSIDEFDPARMTMTFTAQRTR